MLNYFILPFLRLYKFKRIMFNTAVIELRNLYAGSMLGLSWVVVGQLILLAAYVLIYTVIFKVKPENMAVAEYILYVFSGLVPYVSFSASLQAGAISLSSDRDILLSTTFPPELLPARSILISSAPLPFGMLMIVGADVVFAQPTSTTLLIVVVFVLQIMFQCGIAWILSLLTLVLKDLAFILQYISMLLLIVTPIAYTPDMASGPVRMVMYVNPLYYFANAYQSLIVFNRLPDMMNILIGAGGSILIFCTGYWIFQRAKSVFYDYV
ncbi:hypothetical protein OAD74_08930 [Alphaproteobacteria bacterium]|nr:hypothetical protein [Alphaproteobacteria bacterium]